MDKIEELLTRGVANIIPNKEELKKVLASGKKLNVYLGIDATATRIHLGHAVVLRKLQEFAKLGHNVTFLIGDFTALIGDTSDKDTERPVLTPEEIQKNFKTYKKQAEKILDFTKIQVKHNSEWLSKLSFEEIIKLCQKFGLGDFIGRELIRKRLDQGSRIGLHEFLYPVMQGYDSYFLNTDIQIGGTDQTFNMQAGRTLIKELKNKESFVLATEFLMGTDGRKMSKSWGNAIWLDDNSNDMFAKIMAINDDLIDQYFILGTNIDTIKIEEIKNRHMISNSDRTKKSYAQMEVKKELAKIIVTELHSEKDALNAEENFKQTVQGEKLPDDIPVFVLPKTLISGATITSSLVATNMTTSKAEAKRVIGQGGTALNDKIITNPSEIITLKNGDILRVGKRKFVKIKIK